MLTPIAHCSARLTPCLSEQHTALAALCVPTSSTIAVVCVNTNDLVYWAESVGGVCVGVGGVLDAEGKLLLEGSVWSGAEPPVDR